MGQCVSALDGTINQQAQHGQHNANYNQGGYQQQAQQPPQPYGGYSQPGAYQNGQLERANDYELVIRSSKELEHVLAVGFGAQGKGLHEKADSVPGLSADLRRKIHFLATIRNKLVHEYDFHSIPDRQRFIQSFHTAQQELSRALQQHRQQAGGAQQRQGGGYPPANGRPQGRAGGGGGSNELCKVQ